MTWNSRTPASSQESEDLTLGLNVPDGEPSPSREIDPYASAVLAERWPGVPNLGDVIRLDGRDDG